MQDVIDKLASELARTPEPGFDIASTVASGRQVVRRRRIAAGGAVLATALVLGGVAWAVAPGNDGRSDSSDAAVEPPSDPSASVTTTGSAGPVEEVEPVVTGTDGEPVINPDAEIIEQSDYTSEAGETVDTFHIRLAGTEYFVYISANASSSFPRPAQGLTLNEWAKQSLDGPAIADDGWVRFDNLSHLVPVLEGLKIVRQTPNPGLGDNFAGLSDPTALAQVDLDGTTFFLAVRSVGGGPVEAIPFRRDDTIKTFAQFRTFAMNQYATNESGGSEGMR